MAFAGNFSLHQTGDRVRVLRRHEEGRRPVREVRTRDDLRRPSRCDYCLSAARREAIAGAGSVLLDEVDVLHDVGRHEIVLASPLLAD